MNCSTANNIDMVSLLIENGHKPYRKGNNCVWFSCPYRQEKTPSFKIENNRFKDFGTGQTGGVVDLAVLLWNCSVSDALRRLSNYKPDISVPKQTHAKAINQGITVIEVKPIQSKPLFSYLWKRKISPQIGKDNLKEVVFTWDGGKPQYALGFHTNSGSWELRNSILKLASSPKDITLISKDCRTINVFEGFFDYLSYLQLRNNKVYDDILVLNSTVNVDKAILVLKDYNKINCFLDNDLTGRKTLSKIEDNFSDKVHDFSKEYEPYKDLNDFLTSI